MDNLIHRSPSVGSIVKKVININPSLRAQEIIDLIRQATQAQGELAGEYASVEVVDEELAISLARATLSSSTQNISRHKK